jgi:hypothetical protein
MKKITFLLMVLGALSACQPKKDAVRAAAISNTGLTGIAGQGLTNQCAQGQSNLGAIYENTQTLGLSFQDRVKSLLTATMSPSEVGTVGSGLNETTGVRFAGVIKLDANGNVVQANSKLTISVFDSIWYQNSLLNPSESAILLEFDPAAGAIITGQFNLSTGAGSFSVKDQFGEIRFDGTFNAQSFSGTVTYRNTTNVTGAAAASGTLGQFLINTCGIIQR